MHMINPDQRDEARDGFRAKVLEAMDEYMRALAAENDWAERDDRTGARDADLPELFRGLDAQFERNLTHLGVIVRDGSADDFDKADQRWASQ